MVSTTGTGVVTSLQLLAVSQVVTVSGEGVVSVNVGTRIENSPLPFTMPVPRTLPLPSVIVTVVPISPVPVIGVVVGLIGLGITVVGEVGAVVSIVNDNVVGLLSDEPLVVDVILIVFGPLGKLGSTTL